MHVFVLVLGLVAAAMGLAAFGYGFVIKEFSFGGTLLIVGATTFVGGLVMIAVAGAIRELRRIAQALASRPAPMPMPRFPRPGEPFDPNAPGVFRPPVTNTPPVPPVPPFREPRRRDTRLEMQPAAEPVPELNEPAAPSLQPSSQSAAEPPAELTEPDAVPLSPHEMPAAPAVAAPEDGPAPTPEPEEAKAPGTSLPEAPAPEMAEPDVSTEPVSHTGERPESPAERRSPFDAIWPPRERTSPRRYEAVEAETGVPSRLDHEGPSPTASAGAADPAEATPGEPPMVASDASLQPRDMAEEPETPTPPEPHAVSILKSGVVDGMAYTLYSDGSIEAELATGTIRFASINELRLHLEKAD